jgi:hypothetical protein
VSVANTILLSFGLRVRIIYPFLTSAFIPIVSVPIVTPSVLEMAVIVRGSSVPTASIICMSVTEMSLNSSVMRAFSSTSKMSLNSFTSKLFKTSNVSIRSTCSFFVICFNNKIRIFFYSIYEISPICNEFDLLFCALRSIIKMYM